MKLALVIISYNTKSDLEACLISVREKLGEVTTVVVDNGSSDGSQEMVRDKFPWVRLVENVGNLGYASACNLGIKATSEPYVFILNSDVKFLEDGLEKIIDYLDSHPDVGSLGPMVLNNDGTTQMSCRRFPSIMETIAHGFLGDVWPNNPFTTSYQMKDIPREEPCPADWVSGAAMLLRRDAVEKVGGFDEAYFMYVEDVDLCWQMKQAGFAVIYHPDFRLVHHIGRASRQESLRMLYHHHRSMYIFFRKRHRGLKGLALLPPVIAGLVVRVIMSLIMREYRVFAKQWSESSGCRYFR